MFAWWPDLLWAYFAYDDLIDLTLLLAKTLALVLLARLFARQQLSLRQPVVTSQTESSRTQDTSQQRVESLSSLVFHKSQAT